MSASRRLFLIYLTALGVLLASVVVTMVVTEMASHQLEADAKTINLSGRQRTLSQRIAYLAQDLHGQNAAGTATVNVAGTNSLESMIDLFEASHDHLVRNTEYTALYMAADGPSLDTRVRDFIALARRVAADPSQTDSLNRLKQLEAHGLPADLDTVVSAIEAASVARVSFLQTAARLSTASAFVLILIEICFVFLPGHRLIERTMDQLRNRNDTLDRVQKSLEMRNRELIRSNANVLVERRRVQQALDESEALRNEQIAFTYAVSHDLKSPANTLHLLLEELTEHCGEALDDTAHELLDHGRKTLSRMNAQVEDVLAYATATKLQTDPDPVNLASVVEHVISDLGGDIAAAKARITVGSLDRFWGFQEQISSLVQNLVSNALKYRHPDTLPEIRISSAPLPDGDGIELQVADNGIGIAPENHAKIFELFQRLHLRSEFPGSGLGLSTCARIARNHRGKITVSSTLGRGATFKVILRDPRGRQLITKEAA